MQEGREAAVLHKVVTEGLLGKSDFWAKTWRKGGRIWDLLNIWGEKHYREEDQGQGPEVQLGKHEQEQLRSQK